VTGVLTHCRISVTQHVCVVEFVVPSMQAGLNHLPISYIQQMSLQACCLMKRLNLVVLKDLTHNCSYDSMVVLFKPTNLMSFDTGQPSGAEGPDSQLQL